MTQDPRRTPGLAPFGLAILLVTVAVSLSAIFLVPWADCPKCALQRPGGAFAFHDIVALRAMDCCAGKRKVTVYRRWRIGRALTDAGFGP